MPRNSVSWFANKKYDKERMVRDLVLADKVLSRLSEILNEKLKKVSDKDFDKAGWPYYRAYQDGYNKALDEINELIKEAE